MYDEMSWFISYRQFLIILHTLYFCAGKIRTYTLYFFYLFGHLPTNKVLYHAVFWWWWWWWWWWWIVFVVVDRRKAFSLISSQDHCQRSSSLRISDTLQAGFKPAQNLSSGLVEWSCAVVITTTTRRRSLIWQLVFLFFLFVVLSFIFFFFWIFFPILLMLTTISSFRSQVTVFCCSIYIVCLMGNNWCVQ